MEKLKILKSGGIDEILSIESNDFWVPRQSKLGIRRAFLLHFILISSVLELTGKRDDFFHISLLYLTLFSSLQSWPLSSAFNSFSSREIMTRVALDREDRAVYEASVEVTDEGQPPKSGRATVRVLVTDVNDNSPTFIEPEESSVSIREEQPAGTEVLQVRATDRDEGNNASITYTFLTTEDTDDDGAFAINPRTGSITTTKVLDHEAKSVYQVVVQATDQGNPPRSVNMTIRIDALDLNDNSPTFSSSSLTFTIREGIEVGGEIGQVMAVDRDGGDNGRIAYSILSGNLNGTFDINRTTGQLFTTREVDYELISEYMLQVKAIDSSSVNPQSSIINIKIEVEDINDQAPVFKEDPVIFSISESLTIGSVVWNFTAFDLDSGSNGEVLYSLTQQTPKKAFKLDSSSGVLTLMTPLDHEEIKEYLLVVTATDQPSDENMKLRSSVTARILVEDYNDNAPTFVSKNRIDILEDEPIGFPVLHVRATDHDSLDNGRITYIINSGNEKGHFDLEYETGILTVAKPLDRETISHYMLNVTASDHGEPQRSAVQKIDVFIVDINDNAPKFSQAIYRAEVSEGSSPGTHVTRVTASDNDQGSNGNLTYIIPAGIGDNKFRINPATGEIRTRKEEYSLTVYVRDGALPALYDTASVLVSLSDINDHAPEFRDSCYPLRVPENTDLSVIHTVLATDKDSGNNGEVTYSIVGGDPATNFNIDSYTGQLSAKPLDREETGKYYLVIAAEDRGETPLRGICNITITVEDQNDNDPQFTQNKYSMTVPENTPLETTVLQVQARDRDKGENARITYSLSNETQWLFKIDNETGIITTAGEKQSIYNFEVRAIDGGSYDARSESAQVQITISDINDNEPVFTEYPFKVQVPIYKQPGQQLVKVVAEDKDEGSNGDIVYSLVNKESSKKFRIDSETGVVTAISHLSLESGKIFHLEVIARDRGNPPQSSTGLIEIHVGDTSSSTTLQFQKSSYFVKLEENSNEGSDVVQVVAVRSDGRRQRITYSFVSGNEHNVFEMNSNNGLIRVRDHWKLDYETITDMRLTVMAQTEGDPPLYAYTSVHVPFG
ncbi:Protein dachsous [Armadillidium nasatum]|uniref:Protein dachsous n=1 Tax=Armadillidium nasatum TaxID=96803 RepID=A0A5N5SRI4_9CRUS|nr:Protein dachsous [Armadillidium nasatum]